MAGRGRVKGLTSVPLGLAGLGTIAYAIWIAQGEDEGAGAVMDWVYNVSIALAGVSCLLRALVTRQARVAWVAFGVGLISWAAADTYWVLELQNLEEIPYPSWADVGYLFALPCLFVGIAVLIKRRVGEFTLASWFDGLIASLAAAALGTAFLAPTLIGLTDGEPAVVFTNLAYPLGDLILLAFISGALVVSGVRRAGSLLMVGAGLLIWCLGDILYLYQTGTETYVGGWTDITWPVGAVVIAASAQFAGTLRTRPTGAYRSSLLPPAVSTLIATGILVVDHFDRLHEVSIWLAGATVLAAVIRLAVSFRENAVLTRALRGEAVTDALTGLGNRRKLLDDLENLPMNGVGPSPTLFAMFDLDGFKTYNDSFGHPAGDALLQRLGRNLSRSLSGYGAAYRLGGDEFCILSERSEDPSAVVERARESLSERGEGFAIGASGGWLLLPDEAASASEALRLADQRMYTEKNQNSTRSGRQTQELLMRILHERDPALGEHVDDVCRRAVALGRAVSLPEDELEEIARAAKLHDIGKIAIPDDILQKKGPLDEIEWTLMKRHTLIGERILGASPALNRIGRLVRASHERWDGKGYPDGLVAGEIPLGARIIFISDAFDAMTTDRPYRGARTDREALAELQRCAGTQFDPDLVEIFCLLVENEPARSTAASAASAASATVAA